MQARFSPPPLLEKRRRDVRTNRSPVTSALPSRRRLPSIAADASRASASMLPPQRPLAAYKQSAIPTFSRANSRVRPPNRRFAPIAVPPSTPRRRRPSIPPRIPRAVSSRTSRSQSARAPLKKEKALPHCNPIAPVRPSPACQEAVAPLLLQTTRPAAANTPPSSRNRLPLRRPQSPAAP